MRREPEDINDSLIAAARAGQIESIYALVRSGADPNFHAGVNGWPALMHAVHKKQLGSVAALLEAGANVNESGPNGETAIMMAAGYGYAAIVRTLLAAHADPFATMRNGDNALDFALSGVMDIDRFTFGHCQREVVRVLRGAAPTLLPTDTRKLRSCA